MLDNYKVNTTINIYHTLKLKFGKYIFFLRTETVFITKSYEVKN